MSMLVITPLGHVAMLTSCNDGRFADVERPPELNDAVATSVQVLHENSWLQQEGFVELVVGRIKIESNPELENLCIKI
jgi:hypothetical protein